MNQLLRSLSPKKKFLPFIQYLSIALITISQVSADEKEQKELFSGYGINKPVETAAASKEAGATFITIGTEVLVPAENDEAFSKNLAKLKASELPIRASNNFIRPKHLRCVGEEANHDEVLKWAETVFSRIKQANGKMVIFGSGGSRKLNNGWPKEKADVQFVELLKKMGPIAEKFGVTVALEQLNSGECNYINTITEAATIVRAADHPNIRLLADLYHMAKEGDTPEQLKAAADLLVHVEIAEKKGRTYPGVAGDDFKPYFRALRDGGYSGAIGIEGNGKPEQLAPAIAELKKQAAEVMAEKPGK